MSLDPEDLDRALRLKHADSELQIEFVGEMELELKLTFAARRQIAELWGVSPRTVYRYLKQAEKELRSVISAEEVRQELATTMAQLEFIARSALKRKKAIVDREGNIQMVPEPDHKAAGSALKEKTKLLEKLVMLKPEEGAQYKGKSLQQLLAIAQNKLLPGAQQTIEIDTEGEGEDEAKPVEVTVSDSD